MSHKIKKLIFGFCSKSYQKNDNDGDVICYITPKEFWDNNHHMDDKHLDLNNLPFKGEEIAEGMFSFSESDTKKVRKSLEKLGYEYNADFDKFCKK